MSYPTRTRVPPAQYTPGQGSSYGPSTPSLLLNGVNGSRSNCESCFAFHHVAIIKTKFLPCPRGNLTLPNPSMHVLPLTGHLEASQLSLGHVCQAVTEDSSIPISQHECILHPDTSRTTRTRSTTYKPRSPSFLFTATQPISSSLCKRNTPSTDIPSSRYTPSWTFTLLHPSTRSTYPRSDVSPSNLPRYIYNLPLSPENRSHRSRPA